MNKTAKRIIAGVSAAVMFVSAVGVGTFTNSFMETSYADSSSKEGKNGRSTGFSNLEQDTDKDNNYYNTGYGLHTNKTAKAADGTTDGRTFDVDLESWYVGENPVDVATVLDASGSMAWTVDTIDPLEIDDKEIPDILGIEDYNSDGHCDIKDVIAYQDKNGGYLPQDVVDKILDKKNTDNSKLSYADYKYYVYEDRSSVSEFVPLGYWDGGEPTGMVEPIGYYPFEGSLTNEITGASATLVKHAEETSDTFSKDPLIMKVVPEVNYNTEKKTGDLKISDMINEGALLSDVNCNGSFTISIRVQSTYKDSGSTAGFDALPLVYIGDIKGNDYLLLQRRGSGNDVRKVELTDENDTYILQSSNDVKGTNTNHVFGIKDTWVNISIVYNAEDKTLQLVYSDDSNVVIKKENNYEFSPKDYRIILGGNIKGETLNVPETFMTDVCVFNKALNEAELNELNDSNKYIKTPDKLSFYSDVIANYNFDDSSNYLANTVTGGKELTYIPQPVSDGGVC